MCISDLQFEVIECVQFKRTGPEVRERERERERENLYITTTIQGQQINH